MYQYTDDDRWGSGPETHLWSVTQFIFRSRDAADGCKFVYSYQKRSFSGCARRNRDLNRSLQWAEFDPKTRILGKSIDFHWFQWVSVDFVGFGSFHRALTHSGDLARLSERIFSVITWERTFLAITSNSVAPNGVAKSKIKLSNIWWKINNFRYFPQISMTLYQYTVQT